MSSLKKVCFIGAGTQGCQNSLRAAASGFEASVFDISSKALADMKGRQLSFVERYVEVFGFEPKVLIQAIDRITGTTDIDEAINGADLVNESLPERMDLKLEFYADLESRVTETTVLTTNTSSLPITPMSEVLEKPERFAALHFNGISRLVDVMPAPKTAPEILTRLEEFARAIKSVPITLRKDVPAYISNNILMARLQEALLLVLDGCASIEDVDRSIGLIQTDIGPFAQMDRVGLDVIHDILFEKGERTGDQSTLRAAAFVAGYVEKGELGTKSGKGFYTYPNAAWEKGDVFLRG